MYKRKKKSEEGDIKPTPAKEMDMNKTPKPTPDQIMKDEQVGDATIKFGGSYIVLANLYS